MNEITLMVFSKKTSNVRTFKFPSLLFKVLVLFIVLSFVISALSIAAFVRHLSYPELAGRFTSRFKSQPAVVVPPHPQVAKSEPKMPPPPTTEVHNEAEGDDEFETVTLNKDVTGKIISIISKSFKDYRGFSTHIHDSMVSIEKISLSHDNGKTETNLAFEITKHSQDASRLKGSAIIIVKVNGSYIVLPSGITLDKGMSEWNGKGFTFNIKSRKQLLIPVPFLKETISEIQFYAFDDSGALLYKYRKKIHA